MGNVLAAGLGQAPARQAGLGAGTPRSHAALTINKVCGSGLMAVALAAQAIRLDETEIVVAGGMESMTNAPYLLPRARQGFRLGHARILDAMIHDGLWDPYDDFHMGSAAERCATEREISRRAQDEYAVESYRRAQAAAADGDSSPRSRRSPSRTAAAPRSSIDVDEEPARVDFARIATFKPSFETHGTITAANASTLADGAAAPVIASAAAAARASVYAARAHRRDRDRRPRARRVPDRADRRHPEGPRARTPSPRRHRSLRDQRGVRGRRDRRDRGARTRSAHGSTCTAARSRSAIRSARAARACSRRCSRRSRPTASAAASRRSASAAAKRSR